MVNIKDSNGEGAKAPSPFPRVPVTVIKRNGTRACGENGFFVDSVWL